jgi:hypothetical protein
MKLRKVYLIASLAALAFVILPLRSIINSARIQKNGIAIESLVSNVSYGSNKSPYRKVTVSFKTSDGKQITATTSSLQHLSSGKKVKIWYNPADPQEIDFGDDKSYNMRGLVISGLLFVFCFFFFIRTSVRDKTDRKLIKSGKKIHAKLISVDRNEKYKMGDKNPWIIKCQWTDSMNNKEYYFSSKDYTIDPAPYLEGKVYIDVYINPANPGKYYMDTSFMPKGNITIG